jgi:hypothetical protein
MKNEIKQAIIKGEQVELDGLTMADKKEMERFADENGYSLNYLHPVHDEGMSNEDIFATGSIINPENSQHCEEAYINADDIDYEAARIDMVLTDEHYRYSGTIADKISHCISGTDDNGDDEFDNNKTVADQNTYCSLQEELVNQYNAAVASGNKYGDYSHISLDMTIGQIIEILQSNAGQAE